MIRVVTSVIAMIVMAMPAHALTAEEIQETSAKVGILASIRGQGSHRGLISQLRGPKSWRVRGLPLQSEKRHARPRP
jgi:hypothetical protein